MFVNNMHKQHVQAKKGSKPKHKYKQAWAKEYQALPGIKMHRIVSV